MRQNKALTHQEAINLYFGGVKAMFIQPMPFTCKCGSRETQVLDKELGVKQTVPIMSLEDAYFHIRKKHREKIKTISEKKKKQLEIA